MKLSIAGVARYTIITLLATGCTAQLAPARIANDNVGPELAKPGAELPRESAYEPLEQSFAGVMTRSHSGR